MKLTEPSNLLHDDLEIAVFGQRAEVLDDVAMTQRRVKHDLFMQRLDVAKVLFRNFFDRDLDLSVEVHGGVDDAVSALAEHAPPLAVVQFVLELSETKVMEHKYGVRSADW